MRRHMGVIKDSSMIMFMVCVSQQIVKAYLKEILFQMVIFLPLE